MRVVAIGSDRVDDGEGERLEPSTVAHDVDADELVLVHDAAAVVNRAEVDDIVERAVPGVDLVVGAWMYADADHGIVQRRGVFSPERLRWANTVGPAVLVSGRALQRVGGGATLMRPCPTCCSG